MMTFEELTPEQQAKASACKTTEDILALAAQEGYELSDEELQVISGDEDFGWQPPIAKSIRVVRFGMIRPTQMNRTLTHLYGRY